MSFLRKIRNRLDRDAGEQHSSYAPPPGPSPPTGQQAYHAPPPGPPPSSAQQAYYAPPSGPPPGRTAPRGPPPSAPPPTWTAAPERSHTLGLLSDAPEDEFDAAEQFCSVNPLEQPRFISSADVERIVERGAGAWGLVTPTLRRFDGSVSGDNKKGLSGAWRVTTRKKCGDTCILSNLPIIGGMYDVPRGKLGVYYEVLIHKMEGTIAVGTACRPYPEYRLPGWNRQSAALHLDDMRKFFEDGDGGRDYASHLKVHPGCVIGCGYEFSTGAIFFTYNGQRQPDAFPSVYMPRGLADVYACLGVQGECVFEVNFGTAGFAWKEAEEWKWRLEGHVGVTGQAGSSGPPEELPAYTRTARSLRR
ncbi:unnamed protein product [Peniophora sp. CBMAI 1063]|nr:unnamed protein product [Peniophora sp. CBMAI 1063]